MAEKQKVSLLTRFSELRAVCALLFGVYGVLCIVWGIGFSGKEELDKAAGYNVNLIAGIGMLLASIAFAVWTVKEPIEKDQEEAEKAESDGASEPAVDTQQ